MTIEEQIQHLSHEIGAVIDRFKAEYDLPVAAVLGVLDVTKAVILKQAAEDDEEET